VDYGDFNEMKSVQLRLEKTVDYLAALSSSTSPNLLSTISSNSEES
jgi:hypothetical protein